MISVAALWLTYFLPTLCAGLLDLRVVLGLVVLVLTDLEGTAAGMAGILPECIVRVLAVPT